MSFIISSDFENADDAQFAISDVASRNLNIIHADIVPKNSRPPSSGLVYLNALDSADIHSNRAYGSDQNYTGLNFLPIFLAKDDKHYSEAETKTGCILSLVINEDDAAAVKQTLYSNGASNVRFNK